jgi:predicted  nucleic acid-binding Zn-ribbon protein
VIPDNDADYHRAEIARTKARIAELQDRIGKAKSNVRFYKDVQKDIQQAKTPLEIAAASLTAFGKLREDGYMTQEELSVKLKEVEHVLDLHIQTSYSENKSI